MASKYPAGETAPPPFDLWPSREDLNDRFEYLYSMVNLAADPSIIITPGTGTSPGRIRATAQGGGGSTTIPDFTIVAASDANNPRRVRVYNGTLGGLTPAEMHAPDTTLPDGTDNHCYLSMQQGTNLIYVKVKVDATSNALLSANVYATNAYATPDGTYLYWLLGTVLCDADNALTIQQSNGQVGSRQVVDIGASADGTILSAAFPR